MKEAVIDKVKYDIMSVDCLIDDEIGNVCSKMESTKGLPFLQKLCDVVCIDLPNKDEKSQDKVKNTRRRTVRFVNF